MSELIACPNCGKEQQRLVTIGTEEYTAVCGPTCGCGHRWTVYPDPSWFRVQPVESTQQNEPSDEQGLVDAMYAAIDEAWDALPEGHPAAPHILKAKQLYRVSRLTTELTQASSSVGQNEPDDEQLAKELRFCAGLFVAGQTPAGIVETLERAAVRLSGGQQSVTLEQVREAFDAQLVVDARIPPEVESAFGAYVTQLRDRVIGWLETAGLSDMERE